MVLDPPPPSRGLGGGRGGGGGEGLQTPRTPLDPLQTMKQQLSRESDGGVLGRVSVVAPKK